MTLSEGQTSLIVASEEKAVEHAVEVAIDLVLEIFRTLGKKAADHHKVRQALHNYCEQYLLRYGRIKVLGMSQSIPLSSIYTPVKVVRSAYLTWLGSIEAIEHLFRQQGRRRLFVEIEERREGIAMANEYQYLNVLGAPGSGKSTFLRRIGYEALALHNSDQPKVSDYLHSVLPVYIELRRLSIDRDLDLETFIQREFEVCGFPKSPDFVSTALKKGKLLVLLDGLDEIATDDLDRAIGQIRDFTDRYYKNRFVLSCRTAFYKSYFDKFSDVVIADFDDAQVTRFIQNWFSSAEDQERGTSESLRTLLLDEKHKATLELAHTPLLLAFICLVYDSSQKLPANRSVLYKKALEILLEKWAAEKRVHDQPVYRDLHPELEVVLLAELAAPAFEQDKLFFTRDELVARISEYLQREMAAPASLNASLVLEAMEVQQGIVVQRASDIYSFSHLTIQEYLTACHFKTERDINRLLRNYFLDPRWQEVFLLRAGLAPADELLTGMSATLAQYVQQTPALQSLVLWAANATLRGQDPQENAMRRVAAFYLATCLRYANTCLRAISASTDRGAVNAILASDMQFRRAMALLLDGVLYCMTNATPQLREAAGILLDNNLLRSAHTLKGIESAPGVRITAVLKQYAFRVALEGLTPWEGTPLLLGSTGDVVKAIKRISGAGDGELSQRDAQVQFEAVCRDEFGLEPSPPFGLHDLARVRNYAYGISLLIQARDLALSLRKTTWEKICHSLVNTP